VGVNALASLTSLMGVIGLRVPGAITYRHLAIRLVSTACKMALDDQAAAGTEPDRDFEPEVVSAVGEAFNNIAVHGFRGREPGPVQIEVDWDDDKLIITMIDDGLTYDPASVALPDLDALPESGMGLFIMQSCMDEVDYRAGPPNVLRLIKHRRREGVLPPPPPDVTVLPGARRSAEVAVAVPPVSDAETEARGDRGSGVEIIGTGIASSGTPSASNWRMKAVGAGDRTGESSRRK
jgi:serine/threonine-protein kinase RsbW